MCDARETGAKCAEIAGFLKMKRSKNKKQKYLKGNQKVQFVKVNLSLKWKKINLL
jgi:hypothetical protein